MRFIVLDILWFSVLWAGLVVHAGIIRELIDQVTFTNNKTEISANQSSHLLCGNGLFSSVDEKSLSPEMIFISNTAGQVINSGGDSDRRSAGRRIEEVAFEFRFHVENVTLKELESHGFNSKAPTTFLIHGFTSGYPSQAWLSAMVEAYTVNREAEKLSGYNQQRVSRKPNAQNNINSNQHQYDSNINWRRNQSTQRNRRQATNIRSNLSTSTTPNSPAISTSFPPTNITTSSNSTKRNSDQNRRDQQSQRQSVSGRRVSTFESGGSSDRKSATTNHNLFIVNWNYAARGLLYPRAVANVPIVAAYVSRFINEKLLDEAKMDAKQIQLIGHSLGAHLAGFVGKNAQSKLGRIYGLDPAGPCYGSITGLSADRLSPNDAHEVITLHTNADLLGINEPLGAYGVFVEGGAVQPGCKLDGGRGVLKSVSALTLNGELFESLSCSHARAPNLLTYRHDLPDSRDACQLVAYECKDWSAFIEGQCGECKSSQSRQKSSRTVENLPKAVQCKRIGLDWQYYTQKARNDGMQSPRDNNTAGRQAEEVKPVKMYLRTGDTQPYCVFQYQVVLELNEPFEGSLTPAMSLLLQDSEVDDQRSQSSSTNARVRTRERNSISDDNFGNKMSDKIYTHLVTSGKRLGKIDHAVVLFRNGIADGLRLLRRMQINYMSHIDLSVRQSLSSRLCPVKTNVDKSNSKTNRIYFEPCE